MTYYFTKQDKLKYIRAYCKAQGATFKRSKYYINNVLAWSIVSRATGEILARSMTIDSAYNAIENGALHLQPFLNTNDQRLL